MNNLMNYVTIYQPMMENAVSNNNVLTATQAIAILITTVVISSVIGYIFVNWAEVSNKIEKFFNKKD